MTFLQHFAVLAQAQSPAFGTDVFNNGIGTYTPLLKQNDPRCAHQVYAWNGSVNRPLPPPAVPYTTLCYPHSTPGWLYATVVADTSVDIFGGKLYDLATIFHTPAAILCACNSISIVDPNTQRDPVRGSPLPWLRIMHLHPYTDGASTAWRPQNVSHGAFYSAVEAVRTVTVPSQSATVHNVGLAYVVTTPAGDLICARNVVHGADAQDQNKYAHAASMESVLKSYARPPTSHPPSYRWLLWATSTPVLALSDKSGIVSRAARMAAAAAVATYAGLAFAYIARYTFVSACVIALCTVVVDGFSRRALEPVKHVALAAFTHGAHRAQYNANLHNLVPQLVIALCTIRAVSDASSIYRRALKLA